MHKLSRHILGYALALGTLGGPAPISPATAQVSDLLLTGPAAEREQLIPLARVPNYRDLMREIVEEFSRYAQSRDPAFAIVVRPGFELLRWDQREVILSEAKRPNVATVPDDAMTPLGDPMRRYIQAIDGIAVSNQFCGQGGVPLAALARFRTMGVKAMSVEHCGSDAAAVQALERATAAGMPAHADAGRWDKFDEIPVRRPANENSNNVEAIDDAQNMLIALENKSFGSRGDWLMAIAGTNYDIVVVDAFYDGNQPLTADEVHRLKFKELGARRLALAWMDVGHAADYRYYWENDWRVGSPSWIVARHDDRPGVFAVEYWHPRWKSIMGVYFRSLMDLGFDGVFLNGSDSYLRFEDMTPLAPL